MENCGKSGQQRAGAVVVGNKRMTIKKQHQAVMCKRCEEKAGNYRILQNPCNMLQPRLPNMEVVSARLSQCK